MTTTSSAEATRSPAGGRRRDASRIVSALVVVACCLTVLAALHPELLLRNTTASGGDMGAHVWFPAYLRDHLLPQWRIAGWAPDWFAGFPAGQFYFPLPALAVVVADLVLPYDIAFKLVTVSGVVAMPAAAYVFGRGLRAPRPTPELLSIATVLFLFFKGATATTPLLQTVAFNQGIMGGTLRSTLAGEFSFSIALSLALCFLGTFGAALDRRIRPWVPAALLAATVLSHLVVGIFAIVGGIAVLLTATRPVRRLPLAAAIGGVAAAVTACWSLPLLTSFSYTANMRYEKITEYTTYLFPTNGAWVGPFPPFTWWMMGLAAIGAVLGVALRRRATVVIMVTTTVFGIVFVLWPELHAWNLRFLPFWYFGLGLLAATAVGEGIRWASLRIALRIGRGEPADVRRILMSATLVALTVFCLGRAFSTRGFIDFWAEWNYSGYQDVRAEATRPKAWPEFEALIDEMRGLPAGRAIWEGGGALDNYGTPLALELLPYFTDGRIQSVEGLYFESAATTPYHFMGVSPISGPGNASNPVRGLDYRQIQDFDLGVRWMQVMGEEYYLAWSEAAKAAAAADARLRLVATTPDTDGREPFGWSIYRVRGSRLVEALETEPVVTRARAGTQNECFGRPTIEGVRSPKLGAWECISVGWFNDTDAIDRPLAADGPASWAREPDATRARTVRRESLPEARVTDVRRTDHSISFRVSRVGVPIIVRESYYPNWRVQGAEGPFRVTPNFMVVVPTSREVTLQFERSGMEWFGILVSLIGLAGLVVLGLRWPPLARWGEPHPVDLADDEVLAAASRRDGIGGPAPPEDSVEALARDLEAAGHPEPAAEVRAARRGTREEVAARLGPALRSVLAIDGLDPGLTARAASLLAVFDDDGPGGTDG
ncbi:MAG: hypothetical protein ACKOZL_08510 [Actinomycetes bacterium]